MIRKANQNDVPQILEIINEVIINTTAIYEYEPWTLQKAEKWFQKRIDSGFPVIVMEKNGEFIGYGTYSSFRERIAYRFTVEHSIYIHQSHRGKGHGHILLQELIQLAKNEKIHSMIGVVDATNTGSIEFHKQHAFDEVGKIKEVGYKFDRWLDVVLLQRVL